MPNHASSPTTGRSLSPRTVEQFRGETESSIGLKSTEGYPRFETTAHGRYRDHIVEPCFA